MGQISYYLLKMAHAAVIDLLLGLLPVQKNLKSIIEMGNFYHGVVARCRCTKICSESSIEQSITLIWVSSERCFTPAEVGHR